MRIVSGSLKGRKLKLPTGVEVRPTSERVREAMFSSLESESSLCGLSVLDIFAGSGALGIEAISRGASRAVLVEKQRKVVEALRGNVRDFGLSESVFVENADAYALLVGERGEAFRKKFAAHFDLVFADPPYAECDISRILGALRESAIVKSGGRLVLETAVDVALVDFNEIVENLSVHLLRDKVYGDTRVYYFSFQ